MIENLPNYLIQDETYIYCKKEDLNKLQEYNKFIPLDDYMEQANVRKLYYNVIGFIDFKQVVIKE